MKDRMKARAKAIFISLRLEYGFKLIKNYVLYKTPEGNVEIDKIVQLSRPCRNRDCQLYAPKPRFLSMECKRGMSFE